MPPRVPDMVRPPDPARPLDPLRRPSDIVNQYKSEPAETRRLSVGREITLSGEINSCDKLFIEGSVEANLTNCRDVDIAEGGLFKGSASIDEAEVRGRFEGNLTVRKRLLTEFGIEIGGGLGPFKGAAWRIGLMGASSTRANVTSVLAALETILADAGVRVSRGAALEAAARAY